MLEKMNLTCELVENGEAVLEKLSEKKYDLLLMDVQMPVKDGLAASREIRAWDNPNKDIHIIALTAMAMEEDEQACKKAGMNQFLTKPVHPDKLMLAIAKAMNL